MSLTDAEKRMIGGSDIAALLGDSTWSTPLQLYARIVGPAQPEQQTAPQRRGNVLERAVLELYAAEKGARLLGGLRMTHPRLSYIRSSLDERALLPGGGTCVVDAKTVGVTERRHFGEPGTDQVRRDVLYQMTLYVGIGLAVGAVDMPHADVPVLGLSGADLTHYTVGFDAELYAMIEEAIERFWRDHVEPRKPPPVTEPMGDLDAVSALYPSHEGEALDWNVLDAYQQALVTDYLRARAERVRAVAEESMHEAALKMALGAKPQLVGLPDDLGAARIDWKQNKPSTVTDWQALAHALSEHVGPAQYKSFVQQFTTTKPGARPLRVIERKGR